MTLQQLDWLDQASARQRQAEQRLQLMVDERAASYETRRYREHREAALKGRAS